MDKRAMTATATPCPKGSRTKPCGMITVISPELATCGKCQTRWSLADLGSLRRAIMHRKPRPHRLDAQQLSMLTDVV